MDVEQFTREFFEILDETFVQHHGIFLDRGTSLFETLETISAEVASRSISATCASLAAQVAHVTFYIDILTKHLQHEDPGKVDWGEIWRTIREVTPEQWEASKLQLKNSYHRVRELMKTFDAWNGENDIGGALAILVHTAYHLGEIRQALCTLR